VGSVASSASDRVQALKDTIDNFIGTTLGAFDATTAWEKSVDDLTTAVVANGVSLDAATEQGRAVRDALSQAARAAIDHANATAEETGDLSLAVGVLRQHREQLIAQVQSFGLTRQAAEAYVNQLGLTPENIDTLVSLDAANAQARAAAVQAQLDQIDRAHPHPTVSVTDRASSPLARVNELLEGVHDRHATVTVDYLIRGGRPFRLGGIARARDGLLQAGVARSPMVYFGELETGGEAFVPRRGNPNQSRAVLAQAAGWYGMEVRPRGTGGDGPSINDFRTYVTVQVSARGSITDQRGLIGAVRDVVGVELDKHDRRLARELGAGTGRGVAGMPGP
jgi:hypothetical protein